MKRTVLYAVIGILTLLVPVKRLDVAKLRPVEVIYIYQADGRVVLETDTQDMGVGDSAAQALEDMRSTSPAVIYLDTAEFLLIGKDCEEHAEALRGELKESVRLCRVAGTPDLQLAAKYLSAHGDLPTFRAWKADTRLPRIHIEKEVIKKLKKGEKVLDKQLVFC